MASLTETQTLAHRFGDVARSMGLAVASKGDAKIRRVNR